MNLPRAHFASGAQGFLRLAVGTLMSLAYLCSICMNSCVLNVSGCGVIRMSWTYPTCISFHMPRVSIVLLCVSKLVLLEKHLLYFPLF